MSRLLIIIALALALFFFAVNSKPLVLGMAGDIFISPKRPSFAFVPSDSQMNLAKAHKMNIFPEVQDNLVSVNNVMAYYAYYQKNVPKQSSALLCLMALNDGNSFAWLIDTKSEFAELHKKSKSLGGYNLEIVSFVLPLAQDPFHELADAPDLDNGYLVRRYTLFAFQRKAKIVIEYREAYHLSDQGLEIFVDPKANADFEQRADESFKLLADPKTIPQVENKFEFDNDMARRNELSKYVGKTMYMDKS